jgi:hypothetical protein
MGLMKRETLMDIKRVVNKMDFYPTMDQFRALLNHGIAALDEIEGGDSVIKRRRELAERERQVKLALADLEATLEAATDEVTKTGSVPVLKAVYKARLTAALINQMLKARGPAWHREWSWYQPRIAEEFGED